MTQQHPHRGDHAHDGALAGSWWHVEQEATGTIALGALDHILDRISYHSDVVARLELRDHCRCHIHDEIVETALVSKLGCCGRHGGLVAEL